MTENDTDGVDAGEWLALGFEENRQDDQDQSPQAALLCMDCRQVAERFTIQGQLYCQAHCEQLSLRLRCNALALAAKEAVQQKLVGQFKGNYPGMVVPYELLRVAANFPGWSVSVEPRLTGDRSM